MERNVNCISMARRVPLAMSGIISYANGEKLDQPTKDIMDLIDFTWSGCVHRNANNLGLTQLYEHFEQGTLDGFLLQLHGGSSIKEMLLSLTTAVFNSYVDKMGSPSWWLANALLLYRRWFDLPERRDSILEELSLVWVPDTPVEEEATRVAAVKFLQYYLQDYIPVDSLIA